eukprot:CAMPEP_0181441884 /NCGR_PEP_ID=MMETSP1110-20121109/23739_1 /TAXON_ID=174948 /ORGANISM="Symbiodinium sp., Strain CCMP421" /LENGTH=329 /DNA_ID=CAMNT_0023565785 /DNA_START=45 /DNA_END=1034 /DNA_ORIENTATION=-
MVVETAAKPPGKAVKPDDSTTVISKMLSWLLRHGIKHKSVGLNSDTADGWVKVNDVLTSEYFKDMTKEILMKVIVDSNAQKLRYQLSPDLVYIRAYSRDEKKAFKDGAATSAAPREAAPAPPKGPPPATAGSTLRGEAPEFKPSASPWLSPIQTPGYPGWPMMPYPPQPSMLPPYIPVQVQRKGNTGGPVTRELGRIKSFYEDKGYGFIECPRVTQQFGRDLFVHKAQLNGFKVGDEVTLTVTVNEAGMPQAQDLQSSAGGPQAKGKGKGKDKGKERGKGDGKGKEGKGKSEGKGKEGKGKTEGKKGKGKGKDKDKNKEEKKPEGAEEE